MSTRTKEWKFPKRNKAPKPEELAREFQAPFKQERVGDLFERLCMLTDSAISKECLALYKAKDYLTLVRKKVNPSEYDDKSWKTFAADYQIVSFWKKFQGFDLGIDREQAAFEKWLAGEESNRIINQTFRDRWSGISSFPHHVEEVLHLSRCKIRSMLGDFDRFEFSAACRFGPGADSATTGSNTSGYAKYRTSGEATPAAAAVLEEYFNNDRRRCYAHECKLVRSSRLSFVRKTALIDRAIEVGPRWNVFLQLGLGAQFEKALRSVGLDIKVQADLNRKAAARAHTDGLATIDIENASGTLCTNLVIDQLTGLEVGLDEEASFADWLDLVLKLRVTHTEYKGKVYRLEMIAGMGNGYTFPLETLIFYGLAWGAVKHLGLDTKEVFVFGDDLIVPKEAAPLLLECLGNVGFKANVEKTFIEGNFYESCGHDYFKGKNVRPFFLKEEVSTHERAFALCNQVLSWGQRLSYFADSCPRVIYLARYKLINGIPAHLRAFGPVGQSDGVIHSTFDECNPRRPLGGWEGWLVRGFIRTAVKQTGYSARGHLHSKLHGGTQDRQGFVRRDETRVVYMRDLVIPGKDLIITDEELTT